MIVIIMVNVIVMIVDEAIVFVLVIAIGTESAIVLIADEIVLVLVHVTVMVNAIVKNVAR